VKEQKPDRYGYFDGGVPEGGVLWQQVPDGNFQCNIDPEDFLKYEAAATSLGTTAWLGKPLGLYKLDQSGLYVHNQLRGPRRGEIFSEATKIKREREEKKNTNPMRSTMTRKEISNAELLR